MIVYSSREGLCFQAALHFVIIVCQHWRQPFWNTRKERWGFGVLAEWGRIHSPNFRCLMIICLYCPGACWSSRPPLHSIERSRPFYSINTLGKVHNSFQVLNGANHALEAFIILQSSEGVQAISETNFRHIQTYRQKTWISSFLGALDYLANI